MSHVANQWQEIEIAFTGPELDHPYEAFEASVEFIHSTGRHIQRPVFWDGGQTFAVRFASTEASGTWTWTTHTGTPEHRLTPSAGVLQAGPAQRDDPHPARRHGFGTIPPSARTMTYADGTPAFLVADTAWAMPFRATLDDVAEYARNR